MSPMRRNVGARRGQRHAHGRGHDTVDPVGAAVGEMAHTVAAGRRTTRRPAPASTTTPRASPRRGRRRPARGRALALWAGPRREHVVDRGLGVFLGSPPAGGPRCPSAGPQTARTGARQTCAGSATTRNTASPRDRPMRPTTSPAPARRPTPPATVPAPSKRAARPSRSTTVGVWSAAKPGWRSRSSKAATVVGRGSRQPDRGSASTGQPTAAARAWTASGSPAPAPATMTPRG